MEVFVRGGILAAETRCKHCGFSIEFGPPAEELPDKNKKAFQEMFQAAKGMLAGKDPADLAAKAGAAVDSAVFHIFSLGKELTFSSPEYICTTPMHD